MTGSPATGEEPSGKAPLCRTLVPRHAVPPMEGGNGLSDLQHAMIHDAARIRVFSAPTGAGKSYAFQHAVLDDDPPARVLFIVPTRRLADNLAHGTCEEFKRRGRADEIPQRVFVWSSDQAARDLAADPNVRIGHWRIKQVQALDGIPSKGVMIIATPESVTHAILNFRLPFGGVQQLTIIDLLRFDHIVFDEFHTIQARGMGLCAAIAKLTMAAPNGAKLTFLSATPVEIRPVLETFGIDPTDIVVRRENVVTGTREETGTMRALHGDVRLHFVPQENPCAALEANLDEARICLERGHQLILIYDRLKDLMADKDRMAEILDSLGVAREERLSLNSIDDSAEKDGDRDRFSAIGRDRDPVDFRALIATSSVELGVTFNAGLIVMDAGHDPASFVQRVGRVARGDKSGSVLICAPERRRSRDPWLRTIMSDLAARGDICLIDCFMEIALRASREAFAVKADSLDDSGFFRSMSARAAWCAALFWASMEETAKKGSQNLYRTLVDPVFRPEKVKAIQGWLHKAGAAGVNGRRWERAFRSEALKLRSIAPRVNLVPPKGEGGTRSIPLHLYEGTPELRTAPTRLGSNRYGGEVLEVLLDGPVETVLGILGADPVPGQVDALFPHEAGSRPLSERSLVQEWLGYAERAARSQLRHPERAEALEAAQKLVRLSGIVPTDDSLSGGRSAAAGIL